MKRRDLIFAGLGIAALGTSEALRPRRRLRLLDGGTIAQSLPLRFPGWSGEDTSNLVGPELFGRVAKAIYSEIVPRLYFKDRSNASVMLLAAYGDTQSDLLQVHRPEFCYPAVGYNLKLNQASHVALPGGGILPVRRVVAAMDESLENIVYWTRMGEDFPLSSSEQRLTRISNSIHGFIPDGILMRASMVGDSEASFALLADFIASLVHAIPAPRRKAFIGSKLAQTIV